MAFFTEAANVGKSTIFVGQSKSGRTHQIVNRILKDENAGDVLWITFDNINFEGRNLTTWKVATPDSWDSFDKNVLIPVRSGNLKAHIMVVEGLDIAAGYYKDERIKKLGEASTQKVFGEIGNKMRETMAILRNGSDKQFYSMVTRSKIDIGGTPVTSFGTNNDATQKIITMCSDVVYTSVKPLRDAKGVVTETQFFVQNSSILATQFIQGDKDNG